MAMSASGRQRRWQNDPKRIFAAAEASKRPGRFRARPWYRRSPWIDAHFWRALAVPWQQLPSHSPRVSEDRLGSAF